MTRTFRSLCVMRSIGPGALASECHCHGCSWLSCQQRARSRAGGTEQPVVAVIALASSPGWTTSARAAYQSCARSCRPMWVLAAPILVK